MRCVIWPAAFWEQVRHKVMVVCPDGGADEQLAGRLVSETFPNLFTVVCCMAHGVHGAVKDWLEV